MIFLTSDLHFNHDREFVWKVRGFDSVQEMNEVIVEKWNTVVSKDDDVYVLGDLCLGGGGPEVLATNKTLIESLNGKLHIIRGNHDTDPRVRMYETCANVVDVVKWADMLHYRGYHFYLSHFPTLTSNLEKESLKQCTCNLFGHTHQKFEKYIPTEEGGYYLFNPGALGGYKPSFGVMNISDAGILLSHGSL